MKIVVGDRTFQIESLRKITATNKFPDFLFFATAEVQTTGKQAKIRAKVEHEGATIARWKEKSKYQETQGGVFGDTYAGHLVKQDDIGEGQVTLTYELDTGAGFTTLTATDASPIDIGIVKGGVITYTTPDFVGAIGFVAAV